MRLGLRTELLLIIVLAAALPLTVFATFAGGESRRALRDALLDQQSKVAQERAESLARELGTLDRSMSQTLLALAPDASPAQVQSALTDLFLRRDAVAQVALLSRDGRVLASLFVDDPEAFGKLRPEFLRHPVVAGGDVDRFLTVARARLNGNSDLGAGERDSLVLVSDPRPDSGDRLAVDVRVPLLSKGTVGVGDDGDVVLVDRQGRIVAGDHELGVQVAALSADSPTRLAQLKWARGTSLSARAPVRRTGYSVAVLRAEAEALEPLSRLSYVTFGLLIFTLLTALVTGILLSRQLSRPIARLAAGARELATGNLKHRMAGHRVPELEDVARAFNQMAEGLEAANKRLVGFNEELQKQVQERTRELREAQSQLLRSQRLGAVIDLTAGLAHELNNPLAAIIGTAQLLQLELPENDPLQPRIAPIVSEGLRIAGLLKRITALSDIQKGNLAPADLHPLIDEALRKREEHLSAAKIERAFDPMLPPVLADAPALTEVVGHLLDNARQAVEGRSRQSIRVATRSVEGEAVRIEITDNGKGIPREHLERIFNPFFSANAGRKGLGLSLARCHQVIEAHGGKLTVQSEVGVGTTVTLVLPAAPPRAQLV